MSVSYGSKHWRELIGPMGGEPERVLMRQVRIDGEPRHAEILDRGVWRKVQAGEAFVPRRAPLAQTNNDWVI